MPHIELLVSDFPPEVPVRVEHGAKAFVVVRSGDQFSAFEDRCPHASWPLSRGTVRDGVLECPGHGWEFNATTGRCLHAAAYCLKSVSVSVRDNSLRLQWEEPHPEPTPRPQPCSFPGVSA